LRRIDRRGRVIRQEDLKLELTPYFDYIAMVQLLSFDPFAVDKHAVGASKIGNDDRIPRDLETAMLAGNRLPVIQQNNIARFRPTEGLCIREFERLTSQVLASETQQARR
jgi:hypothetical protein